MFNGTELYSDGALVIIAVITDVPPASAPITSSGDGLRGSIIGGTPALVHFCKTDVHARLLRRVSGERSRYSLVCRHRQCQRIRRRLLIADCPLLERIAFSRFSCKRNGGAILILRCFSSIISNLDSTTSLRLCNGQCIEYRLFRINLHALECDCCCLLVLNDYLFYLLCIVNIQAMPLRCFAVHHINFTASDIAYQYLQFAVISGLNDEFATAVG